MNFLSTSCARAGTFITALALVLLHTGCRREFIAFQRVPSPVVSQLQQQGEVYVNASLAGAGGAFQAAWSPLPNVGLIGQFQTQSETVRKDSLTSFQYLNNTFELGLGGYIASNDYLSLELYGGPAYYFQSMPDRGMNFQYKLRSGGFFIQSALGFRGPYVGAAFVAKYSMYHIGNAGWSAPASMQTARADEITGKLSSLMVGGQIDIGYKFIKLSNYLGVNMLPVNPLVNGSPEPGFSRMRVIPINYNLGISFRLFGNDGLRIDNLMKNASSAM